MKYDFKCDTCGAVQTLELGLDKFDSYKEDGSPCDACGEGTAYFKLDVRGIQFSFKGDAWADKNYKEKAYRKNRSRYMAQRQSKNVKKPTLVPNYKGEETSSWKEAQEAARDAGKIVETYEPLITAESRSK